MLGSGGALKEEWCWTETLFILSSCVYDMWCEADFKDIQMEGRLGFFRIFYFYISFLISGLMGRGRW